MREGVETALRGRKEEIEGKGEEGGDRKRKEGFG